MIAHWLLLLAGAGLIVDARTTRAVAAYLLLASVVTALTAPSMLSASPASVLFLLSSALKLIVVPVGLWLFVRRNAPARDLRPSVGVPLRLIAVLAIAVVAQSVTQVAGLAAFPAIGTAAYVILCGLAMLVIYRNLLAQLLGLLALGAGVTLAAAVFAPGLPASVELSATFDALVVTFIGLALVRAFLVHNPLLDVESLRSLRG